MSYSKSKSYQLSAAIALAILLWLLGTKSPPAYACLPAGRYNYTVQERTQAAEIVFEGAVWKNDFYSVWFGQSNAPADADYGSIDAASSTNLATITATVIVHQYLKGDGPAIVEITGFGLGMGDCLSTAEPGDHFIFFANGNPEKGLTTNYLGVYSATEEVSPITVSEAIRASGQTPIEKDLSYGTRLTILLSRIRWWLSGIIIVIVTMVIKFRRQKRKKQGQINVDD